VTAETQSWRFGVAALFALVPSIILFWQGAVDHSFTDPQVAGGAPEHVLGFGLWPFLVPVGVIASILLFWTWRQTSGGFTRAIAAAETVLLVAAAIFAIWSHTLLKARVFR